MINELKGAHDWFEKGEHDFVSEQILFKAKGPTDTISILLQQAVEKYLKGYLISKGWRLKRIHDLEKLMDDAGYYDKSFLDFLDFARELSSAYVKDRYPYLTQELPTLKNVSNFLSNAKKVIRKIKLVMRQE